MARPTVVPTFILLLLVTVSACAPESSGAGRADTGTSPANTAATTDVEASLSFATPAASSTADDVPTDSPSSGTTGGTGLPTYSTDTPPRAVDPVFPTTETSSAQAGPTTEPAATSTSQSPSRQMLIDRDLKRALVTAGEIGPAWKEATGTSDSEIWPCDSPPTIEASAAASRSLRNPGPPLALMTVSLASYEDSSEARDAMAELRENVRDCAGEPVELAGVDNRMYFLPIDIVRRTGHSSDSEATSIQVRQTSHGRTVAEGVTVIVRVEDVVAGSQLLAGALRTPAMDQLVLQVALLQAAKASRRLGRGA